jgi:hypothetical protein
VDEPSARYLELAKLPHRELARAFLRGHAPVLDELAGWEFRGLNTTPVARLGRVRKFVKGFERREGSRRDELVGYNRPVAQNRLSEPWVARPHRFGWYRVSPVDPTERDNEHLHAALLDYGRGGNPAWDPSRGLRDYLVQIDPRDPDLYLGRAYYALGPARIPVSYFVLERMATAAAL